MELESQDKPLLDGKYRVVRGLGEGGFGQVLLAVDEVLGAHQVAIKVLRDPGFDENTFVAEMQALAKLAHPGVVGFLHHFMQFRKLHLVMEHCPGGSLRTAIEQGPLHIDKAIQAVRTVASTLRFVHQHDIVHHDIKPENLLFAADGTLKVGDFGVANRNGGTRVYMAPELFLPAPVSSKDPRIDVYALGVTLLELVSGDLPFWDKSAEEMLQMKIGQDFLPTGLPAWLQEILLKAMHPTPELRFQSMQDFSEALESRYVPYVFDRDRLRAQAMAEKAERLLVRKKWTKAATCIQQALALSDECVAAHMTAGRLELLLKRVSNAEKHFAKAVRLNPRAHIQKDLGWIATERGEYAKAISLLNDHLLRNPTDFEAYNLLLKCYYMTGRYEAGEDLARDVMEENPPSDCFRNNRFLCQFLLGVPEGDREKIKREDATNSFFRYNYLVATNSTAAQAGGEARPLKSKLVFQDYRFGLREGGSQGNTITCRINGQDRAFKKRLISIGSLDANDVVVTDRSVSRRHCVLINFPSDVWLVDLGSTRGTHVDGKRVQDQAYLDGVQTIRIGVAEMSVSSRAGLLV